MKFPHRNRKMGKYCYECTFCNENIGYEFHYLYISKHALIADLRSKFIPTYFTSNPTIHKMKGLLSLCYVSLLKNISFLISKLVDFF